jgi:hypothetical protein
LPRFSSWDRSSLPVPAHNKLKEKSFVTNQRKKRTGLVLVNPQSDKLIGTLILGLFIVLGIISAIEA